MSPVFDFIRKLFKKEPVLDAGALVEELWTADLGGPDGGRFLVHDEKDYASAYRNGAFELLLKKNDLFAWAEAPLRRHGDFALEAELEFEETTPYSSCGFLFRAADEGNFYVLLVSNRGYARLDAVFNGRPRSLVAWTECPQPSQGRFSLRIIARGTHLLAFVQGEWVLETFDETFRNGFLAFAGQNYADRPSAAGFRLLTCLVESRRLELEAWYYRFSYVEAPAPEARFRLAGTYFAMGEWLAAAVQLRKIERMRPLSPDELFLKAEASLRLDLLDEAQASIEACLEAEPRRQEAVEERANILYLRGKYPELRDYAQDLVMAEPENARLWTLLGHARFNLGDYIGAARDYGRAASLEPGQPLCRMNEARAREQAGDRQGAAKAYLAAARGFHEAEADNDFALAVARLEELDPRSEELAALRAKALFRRGEKKKARTAIERLVKAGSKDSALHYLLGLIEAEEGHRVPALAHFERAVELDPAYPLYAFRLAETLFLLERPEADAAIDRALALAPEDGWICNLAATRLIARLERESEEQEPDMEAAEEARRLLKAARAALSEASEPAVNMAGLESLLGRHDAALAELAAFPEDAAARNQAGNVLVHAGRVEESLPEYRKAIGLDPGKGDYRCNLAAALLELEHWSDAEAAVRAALDIEASPRALLLAGNLALVYGDWVRAEAAYRLGLESAPEDPGLLLALGRIYLTARKPRKAEDCAARLERIDPRRAGQLRGELLEAATETLSCAKCGRAWRVPRDLPAQSGASIRAMPPDEAPAGVCPSCGRIFCIGCRKDSLVDSRFTCPDCGEWLKLSDNRLRYLVLKSLKRAD